MQGVFHQVVFNKLLEKARCKYKNILSRTEAKRVLSYNYKVPHYIQNSFLKEMEELGFIELQDKQNILLVGQYEVNEVKELMDKGMTIDSLAKNYNVEKRTIYKWLSRAKL